ncbi:MAG: cobalt-precorrin-6A reductase [Rhodospirillales bacterium]
MADKGITRTVVILGGTTEARHLADQLVDSHEDTVRVITSLAGRTQNPKLPKGEVRSGGFGGADGLAAYLKDVKADLLVDATHPYAAQITAHALAAAEATAVPRLRLDRPAWQAVAGDRWVHVPDVPRAVAEISRKSDACLITTGINDLAAFTPIITTKFFVRLIEAPSKPLPLADAEVVIGRPPYRKDEEIALLRLLGIDLMVSKNAGGDGTYAKLEAARTLGIEVIMIDRPAAPAGNTLGSVAETLPVIRKMLQLD